MAEKKLPAGACIDILPGVKIRIALDQSSRHLIRGREPPRSGFLFLFAAVIPTVRAPSKPHPESSFGIQNPFGPNAPPTIGEV